MLYVNNLPNFPAYFVDMCSLLIFAKYISVFYLFYFTAVNDRTQPGMPSASTSSNTKSL